MNKRGATTLAAIVRAFDRATATETPAVADPMTEHALAMVEMAPLWGVSPGSNRWGDLDYSDKPDGGQVMLPAEAVELALRHGWLAAEHHQEPGYIRADDPLGGELECSWRYHATRAGMAAVEAWRTESGAP